MKSWRACGACWPVAASPDLPSPTPSMPRTAGRLKRPCAPRGLWESLEPSLVLGENIAQAAQFATTGNAVGGVLAYSLVLAPPLSGQGTYALIPDSLHPPLRQRMVLLKRAGRDRAAVLPLPSTAGRPGDPAEVRLRRARRASSMDWTALSLSLQLGLGDARRAPAVRASGSAGRLPCAAFAGKRVVEALVALPLVLPPTVLGFYLLVAFGARSPLGQLFGSVDRTLARVLFRRAGARLGPHQHPVRRPADPARVREHPGRRARCRRLLRDDPVAGLRRASRFPWRGPASSPRRS